MKKTVCSLVVLVLTVVLTVNVNAAFKSETETYSTYSTSEYSIKVPSTYQKVADGVFMKENGDNMNITISTFSGKATKINEEGLDYYVNALKNNFDSEKEKSRELLKQRYGEYLSDAEIDQYIKSFKLDSVNKKEIATVTKNKYKCFHVIIECSTGDKKMYMKNYEFISNNKIYALTFAVSNNTDLTSSEIINMLESFTINNYKEPEEESFFSGKIIGKLIVGVVFLFISWCIGLSQRRKNKRKTQQQDYYQANENMWNDLGSKSNDTGVEDVKKEEDIKDESSHEKVNNKTIEKDKKYCTKCGEKIENDWVFCNYCGNKLK